MSDNCIYEWTEKWFFLIFQLGLHTPLEFSEPNPRCQGRLNHSTKSKSVFSVAPGWEKTRNLCRRQAKRPPPCQRGYHHFQILFTEAIEGRPSTTRSQCTIALCTSVYFNSNCSESNPAHQPSSTDLRQTTLCTVACMPYFCEFHPSLNAVASSAGGGWCSANYVPQPMDFPLHFPL